MEAGCDDFVRKPFTEEAIFNMMAKHLGVRYVYAAASPPPPRAQSAQLTPTDLQGLPAGWADGLHEAATRGRASEVLDYAAQIETGHPRLAETLRALVQDFEFEQIVALSSSSE